MRFICSKCKQIIDEEDAIIYITTESRMIIDVYCPSCYRILKNEIETKK